MSAKLHMLPLIDLHLVPTNSQREALDVQSGRMPERQNSSDTFLGQHNDTVWTIEWHPQGDRIKDSAHDKSRLVEPAT